MKKLGKIIWQNGKVESGKIEFGKLRNILKYLDKMDKTGENDII